jgi:CheY-like chemotaxis protein
MLAEAVRPIEVLLVEDDEGDVLMTREALDEGRVVNRLTVVGDGVEAVSYLRRAGKYRDAVRPDLVLLDLNLPRLSGHEVLADLRAAREPRLRRLPVVVLTTSAAPDDVQRSYDLFASSHIVKPQDVDRLFEVVDGLASYWFGTVALP